MDFNQGGKCQRRLHTAGNIGAESCMTKTDCLMLKKKGSGERQKIRF